MNKVDDLQVVFVIGVGRSGTSLLQSMLHAHPDITFLPETHFFRRYIARPHSRWKHEMGGVEKFRATLAKDEDYQRSGIPREELLAPFLTDAHAFNLSAVYKRLLRLYREREEGMVVGEKDPRLIDYLPQVMHVFPKARILHIVRDPRDVLLSRMNADWSSGRPDWLHVLTYRAQFMRGYRQGRGALGSQYMEVRYEDLLTEPERVLRDVAEHTGVKHSDKMLAFQEPAEELVCKSERGWKEETTGPLLRDNTGKWRKGLSDWQICLTERTCDKVLKWFDYKRKDPSPEVNRVRRALLRLMPIIATSFEFLYGLACRVR